MERPTSTRIRATSCQACAKAKVRCIRTTPDSSIKCQRCVMLERECVPQPALPRKKRRQNPSRIVQLEQKVNGMLSLIESSQQHVSFQTPTTTEAYPSTPIASPPLHGNASLSAAVHDEIGDPCHNETPGFSSAKTLSTTENRSYYPDMHPQEAQLKLEAFRENMAPKFPFVVIPPQETMQSLKEEKPFLASTIYSAITRVTNPKYDLMRPLVRRMLIQNESSLDLLQGVLVYIAWSTDYFPVSPRLSNLLQLAIGLVQNRSLMTPPRKEREKNIIDAAKRERFGGIGKESVNDSLADMRALLGCFYLTSCFSNYFRDINPIIWNNHMQACLAIINERREYDSDVYLVQLIELQLLVEKTSKSLPHDEADSSRFMNIPMKMHISAIDTEMNKWLENTNAGTTHQANLLLHYYAARVYLFESVIYISPDNDSQTQLNFLWTCLFATKSFLDTLLGQSLQSFASGLSIELCKLRHVLFTLSRLSMFHCPYWDLHAVRDVLSMSDALQAVCDRLAAARDAQRERQGITEEESIFTPFIRGMSWAKSWSEKHIATQSGREPQTARTNPDAGNLQLPEELSEEDLFMFLDLDDLLFQQ